MNNKLLLFTRVSMHHRKQRQKILGVCNLVKRQKKKRKEKKKRIAFKRSLAFKTRIFL